jgi:hypothetical protein
MAVISAGAILVDPTTGDGGPDTRLDGFMSLVWHGAHTNEGGHGDFPDIHKAVEIVGDARGGQFEIYFCSTNCLKAFLISAVEKLEGLRGHGV